MAGARSSSIAFRRPPERRRRSQRSMEGSWMHASAGGGAGLLNVAIASGGGGGARAAFPNGRQPLTAHAARRTKSSARMAGPTRSKGHTSVPSARASAVPGPAAFSARRRRSGDLSIPVSEAGRGADSVPGDRLRNVERGASRARPASRASAPFRSGASPRAAYGRRAPSRAAAHACCTTARSKRRPHGAPAGTRFAVPGGPVGRSRLSTRAPSHRAGRSGEALSPLRASAIDRGAFQLELVFFVAIP